MPVQTGIQAGVECGFGR